MNWLFFKLTCRWLKFVAIQKFAEFPFYLFCVCVCHRWECVSFRFLGDAHHIYTYLNYCFTNINININIIVIGFSAYFQKKEKRIHRFGSCWLSNIMCLFSHFYDYRTLFLDERSQITILHIKDERNTNIDYIYSLNNPKRNQYY